MKRGDLQQICCRSCSCSAAFCAPSDSRSVVWEAAGGKMRDRNHRCNKDVASWATVQQSSRSLLKISPWELEDDDTMASLISVGNGDLQRQGSWRLQYPFCEDELTGVQLVRAAPGCNTCCRKEKQPLVPGIAIDILWSTQSNSCHSLMDVYFFLSYWTGNVLEGEEAMKWFWHCVNKPS